MRLRHQLLNFKLAVKVMDGRCLGKTYVYECPTRIVNCFESSAFHLKRTTLSQCGIHPQHSAKMAHTSIIYSVKVQQASNTSRVTTGARISRATLDIRHQIHAIVKLSSAHHSQATSLATLIRHSKTAPLAWRKRKPTPSVCVAAEPSRLLS